MTTKKISRKEFITKTGKCAGGLICTPIILSIFNSCSKPDPLSPENTNEVLYISECPCHEAQFDQNGDVVQYPTTGEQIPPLTKYETTNLTGNSFTVLYSDSDQQEISLSDHPELENVDGVSAIGANEFDSAGLLFYRKSEEEIVALSRSCTHQQCPTEPFSPES